MNHNQSLTFTKEIKSWIAYDAGNSAFATTVIAAFFPLFFSSYWAGNIDEITSAKYFTAGPYHHEFSYSYWNANNWCYY